MLERFSVKKPYTIVVCVILVGILGVISFLNMQTDLLPSMNLPYVVVYTSDPGATAETVEDAVTRPMESAFGTLTGVKSIKSTSSDSLSVVIIAYQDTADMNTAMIEISSAIDQLSANWDDGVGEPIVMKLNPNMVPVSVVSVSREGMDILALSAFSEELVRAYEGVDGVASVTAMGAVTQSVSVTLDEEKIEKINSAMLREVDEALSEVEEELYAAQAELDGGKSEFASQKGAARNKMSAAQAQIDAGRGSLDGAIAQVTAQRDALQGQLDQTNAALQGLGPVGELSQAELDALAEVSARHAALTSQRDAAQAELDALPAGGGADTSALEAQLDQLNLEKSGLAAERAGLEADAATLGSASPDALRSEIAALENGIPPKESALSTASATVSEKASAISAVDLELAALSAETDGARIAALQAQRSGLEAELSAAQGEKTRLEGEIADMRSRLSAARDSLSALEGLGAGTDAQAAAKRAEIGGRIADLDQQIAGKETAISNLRAQIDAAQAGNSDARRAALAEEIANLNAQIAEVEATDAYKAALALGDVNAAAQKYMQLTAAKAQLEAGIAQTNAMLDKLQQGIIPGGLVAGVDEDMDLDAAQAQLSSARSQANSGFSQAESAISQGQQKLNQAWDEFRKARDEAFANANLDGAVTSEMVASILGAENFDMPAGYLTAQGDSYLVSVGKAYSSLEEIEDAYLFSLGLDSIDVVRVRDVANVVLADNRADSFTKVDGADGILLTFEKQSTGSVSDVAKGIRRETEALLAKYPGLNVVDLFNQGDYIDIIIDSVLENLIYGGILAVLVLLLFLMDFRPTLIIAFSIPISVVVAFVCMYFTGVSLNVLSLSGLALGIGMLVDNSIVSIENIYRLRNEGMPILRACVEGVRQVSGALIASTLTTICVFVPVLFVTGLARDLFTDLGLTIAYSLLASLVVAMTLVPTMSAALLKKTRERRHPVFSAIQRGYAALLKGALKVKPLVLLASLALLALCAMQVPKMGISFMPQVNSTQMSAALSFPKETETEARRSQAAELMDRIMAVDGVASVGVTEGGGLLSAGASDGMTWYMTVSENAGRKNQEIASEIGGIGAEMGLDLSVSASTMDMSMLLGSGVSIDVSGEDLEALHRSAKEIAAIVSTVKGAAEVADGSEDSVPALRITVDKDAAMAYGLTVAQVYMTVAQELAGDTDFMDVNVSGRDISARIGDNRLGDYTARTLKDLVLTGTVSEENEDGEKEKVEQDVLLGDIADIALGQSSASISRESQRRTVSVTFQAAEGFSANLVSDDVAAALSDYAPPEGVEWSFSGENEQIMSIMGDLITMLLVALAFIFLIMVAQFQSFKSPIIVMFTIPLAFTGGLAALLLTGMDLSIVSMVGFLVLSGVVVNNGIVFVDCVNQLRIGGMEKREALIEAGRLRLRPILMTALTTILGMSLMALGSGMGSEMMQPMAVVTIGGLLYATLMTLFVVPVLYDLVNGKTMRAREIDMAREAAGLRSMDELLAEGGKAAAPEATPAPDPEPGEGGRRVRLRIRR